METIDPAGDDQGLSIASHNSHHVLSPVPPFVLTHDFRGENFHGLLVFATLKVPHPQISQR